MRGFIKFFTPGKVDPRINVSILSPKSTILNAAIILFYSGLLLNIYDNISFIPSNRYILVGSILTLIIVASICIAALMSYVHYIKYTRPLLFLADAAREVSAGNYSVQIPPHRTDNKTDEIDALYQDFNDMVKELNSTEMLKSNFITNISHELKTPIAVISNYATLLAEDEISYEEQLEYTKKIRETSAELSGLIANILQISKLDNDKIEVHIQSFDVCEELVQCILGFEIPLDNKEIDLDLELPDSATINSDSGLLKIAINNILSNAIKFTPAGGKIHIKLLDNKDNITIVFADSGIGMSKDSIKHIFDKFYQADTSHATKGNGLGLAMTRKIIWLLKGDIDVTSELNAGSTFKIILPKY